MNFTQIMETCNKIKSISSTNEKKEFLASITDEDFKNFLRWLFDSSIVSGLSEKKINKVFADDMFDDSDWTTCDVKSIFDVFRYLENHKTGKDEDIRTVQWYRKQICKNDEEVEFFNRVVTRNLPLGFDVKILNKAIPNLVDTFDVALCSKLSDYPNYLDGSVEYEASLKIDGCVSNDTIITTERGNITIEDAIKNKDKLVLSYNDKTNKLEFKEIEDYQIKDDNKQWYQLTLEDGRVLKITENDRLYIPSLKTYRQVSDLEEGDVVLISE